MELKSVVETYKLEFAEFQKEHPDFNITLKGVEDNTFLFKINSLKVDLLANDDGSFFATDASDEFDDLNSFLLSGKVQFREVLAKIQKISLASSKPLMVSYGSLSLSGSGDYSLGVSGDQIGASMDGLAFSAEGFGHDVWHLRWGGGSFSFKLV
jgi:hypothetical protein